MTISYSSAVATATLGTFARLLFRWKASVHQLVWRELLIFIALYLLVAAIYRNGLDCDQRRQFEAFSVYCHEHSKVLPLTFIMGFYVQLVVKRWWDIAMCIAWPDRPCFYISMCLPSGDKDTCEARRAIARYLNLAQLLVLRDVSTSVKARYKTLDRVVEDKFMTPEERDILEHLEGDLSRHHKYWLPIQWASNMLCRTYARNKVRDTVAFSSTFEQVVKFRDQLGLMLAYDWISIPLSYTQVVTMVVYAYFFSALIGRQYLLNECEISTPKNETINTETISSQSTPNTKHNDRIIEKFLPLFPFLEFLFYMGWLKMAESIMNPLGQDDDDFEINYIINRNLSVSYAIVDSHRDTCPQGKIELLPQPMMTKIKTKSYKGSATRYDKEDEGIIRLRRRKPRGPEDSAGPPSFGPPSGPPQSPLGTSKGAGTFDEQQMKAYPDLPLGLLLSAQQDSLKMQPESLKGTPSPRSMLATPRKQQSKFDVIFTDRKGSSK